jgi:hypothetical protein
VSSEVSLDEGARWYFIKKVLAHPHCTLKLPVASVTVTFPSVGSRSKDVPSGQTPLTGPISPSVQLSHTVTSSPPVALILGGHRRREAGHMRDQTLRSSEAWGLVTPALPLVLPLLMYGYSCPA